MKKCNGTKEKGVPAIIIDPKRSFDKRTIAGKRRELAQAKAPKAMWTTLLGPCLNMIHSKEL